MLPLTRPVDLTVLVSLFLCIFSGAGCALANKKLKDVLITVEVRSRKLTFDNIFIRSMKVYVIHTSTTTTLRVQALVNDLCSHSFPAVSSRPL